MLLSMKQLAKRCAIGALLLHAPACVHAAQDEIPIDRMNFVALKELAKDKLGNLPINVGLDHLQEAMKCYKVTKSKERAMKKIHDMLAASDAEENKHGIVVEKRYQKFSFQDVLNSQKKRNIRRRGKDIEQIVNKQLTPEEQEKKYKRYKNGGKSQVESQAGYGNEERKKAEENNWVQSAARKQWFIDINKPPLDLPKYYYQQSNAKGEYKREEICPIIRPGDQDNLSMNFTMQYIVSSLSFDSDLKNKWVGALQVPFVEIYKPATTTDEVGNEKHIGGLYTMTEIAGDSSIGSFKKYLADMYPDHEIVVYSGRHGDIPNMVHPETKLTHHVFDKELTDDDIKAVVQLGMKVKDVSKMNGEDTRINHAKHLREAYRTDILEGKIVIIAWCYSICTFIEASTKDFPYKETEYYEFAQEHAQRKNLAFLTEKYFYSEDEKAAGFWNEITEVNDIKRMTEAQMRNQPTDGPQPKVKFGQHLAIPSQRNNVDRPHERQSVVMLGPRRFSGQGHAYPDDDAPLEQDEEKSQSETFDDEFSLSDASYKIEVSEPESIRSRLERCESSGSAEGK